MNERDFTPIADSLRGEVLAFYRDRDQSLEGPSGLNTLETNSGLVEQRGTPLLEMLARRGGPGSIDGSRLLDAGCGFGALAAFFAAHGARVTGIDVNEERLAVGRAVAARHGLELELRRGRMEALELPDRSYDLAVLNNSLCYLVPRPERRAALSEVHRVLRPGGLVIVRNPNRWTPVDQFTRIPMINLLPPRSAAAVARLLGRPRSRVRLASPLEASRELRAAGFSAVDRLPSRPGRQAAASALVGRYQHLVAERPL